MPDVDVAKLNEAQVNEIWARFQMSPAPAVLKHLCESKIREAKDRYDSLENGEDFIKHQSYVSGLKDMAGIITRNKITNHE